MRERHQAEHPFELLAGAVLAVISAGAAVLWASAGLGSVLSGRSWPHVTAAQVAGALVALPSHLADPRLAWPPGVRAQLSSPAPFYVALALVVAALAAASAAFLQLRRGGAFGEASASDHAGARWAGRRDLRPLRQRWRSRVGGGRRRTNDRGRLALGYRGRMLLRAEARHALVVFGPPQSGKSAGIAIPALLEWRGPAVASSLKTDLYQATAERRRELGQVMVFDPYGLAPVRGSTWSPLRLASTWDGALSTALRISAAAEVDTSNVKGGGYWTAAAEQRLAPLLWAAARTGGGISEVVRWAFGQGDAQLPEILRRLIEAAGDDRAVADAQVAYDAHIAFEALAGETRSSIESTVQMLLRAYRSPRVQASARSCEITPARLLDGPHTLYLIGDSHRSKLLRPIFLALLQEVVDHAYHAATIRGGRLRKPLLLCLDELGNVAPLPNLAEVASTAPSHNIQLVSIFHDIAQARSRYGQDAETVMNSHRARMLLPGVADLDTLRYFSGLAGEEETREVTRTTGAGGTSRSTGRRRRPLAAAEALRQLPDGHALLIYGRLAPVQLRLRMWFEDRGLKRLAGSA